MKKDSSELQKHLLAQIFIKIIKKLLLLFLSSMGIFYFIVFLIIFTFCIIKAKETSVSEGLTSFTKFGDSVESYRNDVMEICEDNGLVEYTNVILAIMQVETQGQTLDPMNAGN
ncbi:lysozyme family protein, partial [Serratia marcescens]|uniref:lysozyme family protein n=1 Tax=Serratia marcescens TaxID=615 RepID=UPI00165332B9